MNGDGKLDLVAPCTQTGSVVVNARESGVCAFSGNGDGTFNLAFSRFYFPYTVSSLALADFNGNGKLDIVGSAGGTAFGGNPVYLGFLAGNGDGTFQPVITAHGFPTSSPPFFGDFNGDGNLDVEALDTVLLLHNGSSSLYPIPQSPSRQIPYAVGDFNGDGKLDLMATFVGSQDSIQPLLQVAPSPDFDVAVSSSSQTVTAGGTATFTLTITAVNGFNDVVTPSQTGFPSGTTVSYNPPTVTGQARSLLQLRPPRRLRLERIPWRARSRVAPLSTQELSR